MYFFVVCGLCGRFVRREDKFPLIMYTTAKVPHGDQACEHGETPISVPRAAVEYLHAVLLCRNLVPLPFLSPYSLTCTVALAVSFTRYGKYSINQFLYLYLIF